MAQSQSRHRYSREFEVDAVELTLRRKKPPGKSPGILFLSAELQYRRRLKYLTGKEPAFPVTGKTMGSEGESIRQLEKEMRLLTEERDSLKKRLCVQQKNSLKYRFIKEH